MVEGHVGRLHCCAYLTFWTTVTLFIEQTKIRRGFRLKCGRRSFLRRLEAPLTVQRLQWRVGMRNGQVGRTYLPTSNTR